MTDQNLKNHQRYLPVWHLIVPLVLLAIMIGAIRNIVKSESSNLYSAWLIFGISLLLPVFYWYTRWFALRAQDRAIRAEENFRHFLLTGKPFDPRIRLGQVIALRFASDEEMPALAKKAIEEKLSSKEVKKAIQTWRPDYHRV